MCVCVCVCVCGVLVVAVAFKPTSLVHFVACMPYLPLIHVCVCVCVCVCLSVDGSEDHRSLHSREIQS